MAAAGDFRVDVAVIGAGVVGAAIARELSRFHLDVLLVDAASDVGAGTSKANTAILHTGFDTVPESLESRLVTRGYHLLKAFAERGNVPMDVTGALLVAWNQEQADRFPEITAKAALNGVDDLELLGPAELYRLEPHLGPGALGALRIPGEGIICPYTPPLAFATEAVLNGVTLLLSSPLTRAVPGPEAYTLTCGERTVAARWVVNAAGLYSDVVDRMFGPGSFTVKPRRGQLLVFDKFARRLVRHVLLPVPTKFTKGVLVSPTVFGNVLLGPTAEELGDKEDKASTGEGLADLLAKGRQILPELGDEEVTAVYAGLRAATEHQDYQVRAGAGGRYVCVGGIRSTGLSASLALAEHVRAMLTEQGLVLTPKAQWKSAVMPFIGEDGLRPMADDERILADPDYGRIICHCEKVSRGELRDALEAVVPARTLDGLRRRTRCLQGRCQGFYCLAEIVELVAKESGATPERLMALEPEP